MKLIIEDQPGLEEVAGSIGLSEYHFQRIFTRWAGVSPKRFLQFLTKEGAKDLLDQSENLLDTTHQVGLSSLGRLHDLFVTTEAVSPGEYKSRGEGLTIHYGIHPTPFGKCLIATTERGICHLGFVQTSEGDAIDNLVADWKQAKMIEDYKATSSLIAPIFDLRYNNHGKPLNVHLRGTNFQLKVWEALASSADGHSDHLRRHRCQDWQTQHDARRWHSHWPQPDCGTDPLPSGDTQNWRVRKLSLWRAEKESASGERVCECPRIISHGDAGTQRKTKGSLVSPYSVANKRK